MKKTSLLLFGVLSVSTVFADGYEVPNIPVRPSAVTGNQEPLPLLSPETPLSDRDREALKYSNQWLKGKRYPHRDSDRVTYLYGAGQPTLVCAPLQLCVIYLQAGEDVVKNGVHLGDNVRWQISPAIGADNRTQLVVKPVDVGLSTSLVAITNKRTYHIKLVSRQRDYMPGIAFKYPSDMAKSWNTYYQNRQQQIANKQMNIGGKTLNLEDLDFKYDISNCSGCYFKPVRVYNDGSQTVIQMPKSIVRDDAPALLVSSSQGDMLVNYRIIDNRYIVDRLFREAVLIQGVGSNQKKVKITWIGENNE